jgi:hypothetical protein
MRELDFWHGPKSAVATVVAVLGAGVTSALEMIPDDIGKLASLLGVVLTCILIFNHMRGKHLHAYQLKLEEQAKLLRSMQMELRIEQATNKRNVSAVRVLANGGSLTSRFGKGAAADKGDQ